MKSDEAAQKMKSFDDKKRQENIKGYYLQQMKSFVQQLQVPNLAEANYKAIDSISVRQAAICRAPCWLTILLSSTR